MVVEVVLSYPIQEELLMLFTLEASWMQSTKRLRFLGLRSLLKWREFHQKFWTLRTQLVLPLNSLTFFSHLQFFMVLYNIGYFVLLQWSDKNAHKETLLKLAGLFKNNFETFTSYKIGEDNNLTEEILAAGPVFWCLRRLRHSSPILPLFASMSIDFFTCIRFIEFARKFVPRKLGRKFNPFFCCYGKWNLVCLVFVSQKSWGIWKGQGLLLNLWLIYKLEGDSMFGGNIYLSIYLFKHFS